MALLTRLLLLTLLSAAGGFAAASTLSGEARACGAVGGHWQVFAMTCRY